MNSSQREAADPQEEGILEKTKRIFQIISAYVRSTVTYTFSSQRLYTSIDEETKPITRQYSVSDPIEIHTSDVRRRTK